MTERIHMRHGQTVVTNLIVIGGVRRADSVGHAVKDRGRRDLRVSHLRHRVRERDHQPSLDQLSRAQDFRRGYQVGGTALVVRPPPAPVLKFHLPSKIVRWRNRRWTLSLTLYPQ